jgi:hypothetical protein
MSEVPIECSVLAANSYVYLSNNVTAVAPMLAYECTCSPGFTLAADKCVLVVKQPWIALGSHLAAVIISAVVAMLIPTVVVLRRCALRRHARLEHDLELHKHLLVEQEEEVSALRRSWEVQESDIRLRHRVDGTSPGAFGTTERIGSRAIGVWESTLPFPDRCNAESPCRRSLGRLLGLHSSCCQSPEASHA